MHRTALAASFFFLPTLLASTVDVIGGQSSAGAPVRWEHLSSKSGQLPPPPGSTEQTMALVLDIDKDGINDFVIGCRRSPPAMVWYRRGTGDWTRYVMDREFLPIEAGGTFCDIDGDSDLDVVAGEDGSGNKVYWWENPCPDFDPGTPWKRHIVKDSGENKHHDQMFIDTDGDGRQELVFWNQGAQKLFLTQIPAAPRDAEPWPLTEIFSYSADSEMLQRGKPALFKGVNEHEGLAAGDIDGDGTLDIVGGGHWFKRLTGSRFVPCAIDAGYVFSRVAVGQLKKGGRPEVVLVVGDGEGPLNWYEWVEGTWVPHTLMEVDNAHSLDIIDFDGDRNLDIFIAEMRLNGGNPDAKCLLWLGDGTGNFSPLEISIGFGNHESRIADLDGDGTLDILGKPYNWDTPRLDIWLCRR